MENVCSLCKQRGQVFETNQPDIWACANCKPLDPEIDIQVDHEIVCYDRASNNVQTQEMSGEGCKFKCDLCSKIFKKSLQFQNHVRNHTAEKKYTCTYCSKAFSQSNNLRAHLRIHTNERPYKCSQCDKAFTQITNLNNHMRLHTGEKPFSCSYPGCDKAFAQVTNLNQHKKTHEKSGKYPYTPMVYSCQMCGIQFPSRQEQMIHKRDVHGLTQSILRPTKPMFPCAICDESFTTKKLLDKHVANHMATRFAVVNAASLVTCPLKECSYIVAGGLDAHMEAYHKHRPNDSQLKCPFKSCMRYFNSTEQRNVHITSEHFGSTRKRQKNNQGVEFINVRNIKCGNDNGQKEDEHNDAVKMKKSTSSDGFEVPIECEISINHS